MLYIVEKMLELDSWLHWNVTVNPEAALQFAQKVDIDLVEFVSAINDLMPKHRDGDSFHDFIIGREYSRVVYLKFANAYLPAGFDTATLHQGLQDIAKKFKADEFRIEETPGRTLVRFWWD